MKKKPKHLEVDKNLKEVLEKVTDVILVLDDISIDHSGSDPYRNNPEEIHGKEEEPRNSRIKGEKNDWNCI